MISQFSSKLFSFAATAAVLLLLEPQQQIKIIVLNFFELKFNFVYVVGFPHCALNKFVLKNNNKKEAKVQQQERKKSLLVNFRFLPLLSYGDR